jgi:hypothetical protein
MKCNSASKLKTKAKSVVAQQQECPSGCCQGNEILCLSIPCPVSIVLLGINLQLELPCLRLTSTTPLTGAQANQVLQALTNVINSVGTSIQR